jgi:hypothetical protein
MSTERIHMYTDVFESNTMANTNVNTNRFTVKQWEIEGEIPCPICEE